VRDRTEPGVRFLTATAWASFLVFASTSTLLAVCLKQIADEFGIGFGLRGALTPVRASVLAFSALASGYAADRFGKRKLLAAGMLLIGLGLLQVRLSGTYLAVLAGILLLGSGLGFLEAIVSPLVAELHPTDVAAQMNLLHGFYPLGIVASSLAAGAALQAGLGWRRLFGLAALPAALTGLAFLAGRYPRGMPHKQLGMAGVRQILRERTFWLLAAAMGLTAGAEGVFAFWTPNFIELEYRGPAMLGAAGLMAFSIALAVGRFGSSAVSRRVPLRSLMIGLAWLGAAAAACFAVIDSLPASLAAVGVAGLCSACFWPGILSLANERIIGGSATLLAMISVAGIVGFGTVPYLVGLLADAFDLRTGMSIVPLSYAGAALVLHRVFVRPAERKGLPGGRVESPGNA